MCLPQNMPTLIRSAFYMLLKSSIMCGIASGVLFLWDILARALFTPVHVLVRS